MALSPKDREKIVEEEKLRYETRRTLDREYCAKHKSYRWLWWLVVAAIAYCAYCFMVCGGGSCMMGHGSGCEHGKAKHCQHGQMMDGEDDVDPGQPLPPKK